MPRFDQILKQATAATRAQTSNAGRRKHNRTEKFEHLQELLDGSQPHKSYPAVFDVKAYKQKFLKGQDYNILEYVEPKETKQSSYQAELKAKKTEPAMKGPLREKHSCLHGGVIPDPRVLQVEEDRFRSFSKELTRMQNKRFDYTGDSWY